MCVSPVYDNIAKEMRKTAYIMLIVLCCVLVSCGGGGSDGTGGSVPVVPDPEPDDDQPQEATLFVDISADTSLPEFVDSQEATRAAGKSVRYQLKFYKFNDNGSVSSVVSYSAVKVMDYNGSLDASLTQKLAYGKYKMVVFADFIDAGSESDCYYDTSNPLALRLTSRFVANDDYCRAYVAVQDVEMSPGVSANRASALLRMPLARIRMIANDVSVYAESIEKSVGEIPFSKYTVKISCGTFPQVINTATQSVGSYGSKEFSSVMTDVTSESAMLGYFYIPVSSNKTETKFDVKVYDEDGNLVNTVKQVPVLYMTGHQTTVSGKFLKKQNEGFGVDPDFDGEINLEF